MLTGFSARRLERMRPVLRSHVERGEMPGLVALVSRGNDVHVDVVGELSFGGAPMRRDSIFRIASLSKPITAAAAMILVEECKLRLDDPVDAFLPELANRKVLRAPDAPIDDTVPAQRAITLRDLLTFRCGIGAVMAPPGRYPIQKAIAERGLAPGPESFPGSPDAYMKKLGELPLLCQPGERWLYHTGSDILGVLIARASGSDFAHFLRERLFEPLGMKDTGFHVPPDHLGRLATVYRRDPETNMLREALGDSRGATPPAFASGGGGLVSTADDYLAFCRMMLAKGSYAGKRILSRASVELMTTDHLAPEHKRGMEMFFGPESGGFRSGWGFGLEVDIKRTELWNRPGRFGWVGGTGTIAYSDPAADLVGILLTQRMMDSPLPPKVMSDFWTVVYQALE